MIHKYTIAGGYNLLTGSTEKNRWYAQVWSSWNIPKHCFILWLTMHNRLLTKDRVIKYNSGIDSSCSLCQVAVESQLHLFFKCSWTMSCLTNLKKWLQWNYNSDDLQKHLRWIQRSRISRFKKLVYSASIGALVYLIWEARNKKLWRNEVITEDSVIEQIQFGIKNRILYMNCKKRNEQDWEWFYKL